MMFSYIVSELSSRSHGCDSRVYRQEVGSLAEGIDYYHYRIVSVRFQEFDYEVDAYGVPSDVRCREGLEVARWRLSRCLRTLVQRQRSQVAVY
jgi:hypothetical protein